MLSLKRWLQKRFDIDSPTQAQVAIDPLADASLAGVVFERIELPPRLSSDIGSLPIPKALVVDILHSIPSTIHHDHLEQPQHYSHPWKPISVPGQIALEPSVLESPESLDLLAPLSRPHRAGKAYSPDEPEMQIQPPIREKRSLQRCKHGMLKRTCAICRQQSQVASKATKTPQVTVDVFDLLLPFLYPPIDPNTPPTVIFPPDKRPYPFQYEGVVFLKDRTSALLGDEMGLGKTIQAIIAIRILIRNRSVGRALVLCPRSLLGTWERELTEWAPELSIQRVRGTIQDRKLLWRSGAYVFLTTYETLRNDVSDMAFLKQHFDLVVMDEIQRIKNPQTKTSRACHLLNARYRWGLSGTPLENKIDDVIAIFSYLQPDLFRRTTDTYGPSAVKSMIQPYFLRRRASDVLDELPPKVSEEIWLDLTPGQRRAYERAEAIGKNSLRMPNATRIHVFSLINELKQICNWDSASRTSCKLEYLLDQLGNLTDSSEKALVFSHYPNKSLQAIQPNLKEFSPELFDGSISDVARESLISRFSQDGPPHVLLMSVKAGGVGLTLTRANHVFHYDHWWNPAVANQATGRAHRISQRRTVFVWHLYTNGTIEERIYQMLQNKQRLFEQVIDDLSEEEFSSVVTDEDLFGLFGLRPPEGKESKPKSSNRKSIDVQTAEHLRLEEVSPRPPERSDPKTSNRKPTEVHPTGRRRFENLSSREFEHLVADLYERRNFSVEITPFSRDGGVDLIARRRSDLGLNQCVLIQCKHTPGSNIGAPVVRQLLGALREHLEATATAIVTSGGFSSEAIRLAQKQRVVLIDGQKLAEECNKAGLLKQG